MSFPLKRRNVRENFPFPDDGAVILENNPCLIWVPADGANSYTVTVKSASGETVLEAQTEKNYIYPEKPWTAGEYNWNVVTDKGEERGWQSFTVSEKAITFIRPTAKEVFDGVDANIRPRHLFTKEDTAALLADHAEEFEILKRNVEMAYCHGLPQKPEFHHGGDALPYREYFGRYRDYCDRDLVACSLMYALTGDKKAGDYAKSLLLAICDMNPLGPCSLMGQWGDEVGLSNARCLPAVFDMLFDLLDQKQMTYVASTVAIYAEQCETRIRAIDYIRNPSNSHVGRLPAYLGDAALVLKGTGVRSDETLLSWLDYALDIYTGIFPFYGCPDGSWAEGAFYSTSYTKWFLPFFSAVERFSGVSLFRRPFYMRYTQYLLHFCNEAYELHPFGDGYWCHPKDEEWPGFFAQDPYRAYADRFGPELARNRKDAVICGDIDYFRLHLLDIFLPKSKLDLSNEITGNAENAEVFPYGGYAVLHTDIEADDDICVMARASRYTADSHRHADQGSFAIFCGGKALISPSGYFGRRYGTKHHFEWTRQTIAHNVALIDGQGQGNGVDTSCSIPAFDRENRAFTMDITPAYEGRLIKYLRTVSLDETGITVTDEIQADEEVEVTYPLHASVLPEEREEGKVRIARENAILTVTPIEGCLTLDKISDKYGIDLNEGEPAEYHVTMPQQYHIYYTAAKAKNHRITVRYSVEKL
ncbi:MAG: heparinase II/III-family protein [Clostridia bacterium]|nr:heparinase II/III-family protein [Clostridia bacterium]